MIEKTLQSGKVLEITPAPFADAKDVYQIFLDEMQSLELDPEAEVDVNFLKGIFCKCLSSKKLEAAIWKCLSRCKYDGHKIIPDTFEDLDARADYIEICWLAGRENIEPFMRTLMQQYGHMLGVLKKALA